MSDFEFKSETQQNTNVEQLEQRLSSSSYIRVGLVALLSNFGFKSLFKNTKAACGNIQNTALWNYSLRQFKFFFWKKVIIERWILDI